MFSFLIYRTDLVPDLACLCASRGGQDQLWFFVLLYGRCSNGGFFGWSGSRGRAVGVSMFVKLTLGF